MIPPKYGVRRDGDPGREVEIETMKRAPYNPYVRENLIVAVIPIRLTGDESVYSFKDLQSILSLQTDLEKEKERLAEATGQQARELQESIAEKEAEMSGYIAIAHPFIRQYAALRYQSTSIPFRKR